MNAVSKGIVYVVNGPRSYLGELRTSVLSLRKYEPTIPVTVFSKYEVSRSLPVEWVSYHPDLHPLQQKVDALGKSPYDETLFLDADTTVFGSISGIFDVLQTHNFAAAPEASADYSVRPPRLVDLYGTHRNEFNTGVLCFDRSPEAGAFFDRWRSAVMDQDTTDMWPGHNCDQTYFNRLKKAGVMEELGTQFVALPNVVYNCRGVMIEEVKRLGLWDDVRILHHRTRSMKARKLAYSMTDVSAIGEVFRRGTVAARKTLGRVRGDGVRRDET